MCACACVCVCHKLSVFHSCCAIHDSPTHVIQLIDYRQPVVEHRNCRKWISLNQVGLYVHSFTDPLPAFQFASPVSSNWPPCKPQLASMCSLYMIKRTQNVVLCLLCTSNYSNPHPTFPPLHLPSVLSFSCLISSSCLIHSDVRTPPLSSPCLVERYKK